MKIPALLKLAMSFLTKIPMSTLATLFTKVTIETSLATTSTLTGKEKAEKVVAMIEPLVPAAYRAIAGAIVRILIEVWYIMHKTAPTVTVPATTTEGAK
jgi:hypothetical protein